MVVRRFDDSFYTITETNPTNKNTPTDFVSGNYNYLSKKEMIQHRNPPPPPKPPPSRTDRGKYIIEEMISYSELYTPPKPKDETSINSILDFGKDNWWIWGSSLLLMGVSIMCVVINV